VTHDGPTRGRLFVLSGPSGVGKSTVLQEIRRLVPELWYSVSATTRGMRPGEIDGVNYHFLNDEQFAELVATGQLLEWAHFAGNHYGTPRVPVEQRLAAGDDVLLEIDVQGALAVRKRYPDALLVFVHPPSREEQRARLLKRGQDGPEQIERRLAAAAAEEELAGTFDFVVVNDDVDRAAGEVAAILASRRAGESEP
jgi:guanylate kinase